MTASSWAEQFGVEKNRYTPPPASSGPVIVNVAPTIDDPRTRGAVKAAFKDARRRIIDAKTNGEGRNNALNTEAFNLGQLIGNGLVTEEQVREVLEDAARASGVLEEDGWHQFNATVTGGINAGRLKPRDNLPMLGAPDVEEVSKLGDDDDPCFLDGKGPDKKPGPGARIMTMESFAGLRNRIPDWTWVHNGYGRMQLGVLSIFGGPAGSGKSTAARWFAAGYSNGTIPGYWEGQPQNVAYIAIEEDREAMVRPSLEAAGANMERLFYPKVVMDESERIIRSKTDEKALTQLLRENDIRVLIVDPIMGTLGADVEINKNNDVRDHLQPFINIASEMDGIVIGIAHYRKGGASSGTQALTGSAAFGEVARCIFGFMKYETAEGEPMRVMSQSKNSAGREDLAVNYALDLLPVFDDEGREAEVTKFSILGDSDVTVEDIMADGGAKVQTKTNDAEIWLSDYLQINGATSSKKIKDDARRTTEFSEKTLVRAMQRLQCTIENRSEPGRPRVTYWSLPPTDLDATQEADADTSDRYWE